MSSFVMAAEAVGAAGTLATPHPAFTHDFWVASLFISVSVEVLIHVWVSYCLDKLQSIWDKTNEKDINA